MARHGVRRVELRRNLERLQEKRQQGFVTQPLAGDDEQVVLLRRLRDAADRLAQVRGGPRALPVEVLDVARFVSGLDRGLLILRAGGERFRVAAARGLDAADADARELLETAGAEAVRRRRARLDHDPRRGGPPGGLLVALPLEHEGRVLGALVLHAPLREVPLSSVEASLLRGFARQASVALHRRAPAPAAAPAAPISKSVTPTASYAEARRAFDRRYLLTVLQRAGGHLPTLARITGMAEPRLRELLREAGVVELRRNRWGRAAMA